MFRRFTNKDSIFNEALGGKHIELVNPTQVVATMTPKRYRIPKDLEMVHAYHPDYEKLIDFNTKLSIDNLKLNQTTKIKLFIKQKGKCGICSNTLLNETGEFANDGSTHIHHKVARSQGGKKGNLSNFSLVHAECHVAHHQD